MLGALHASLLTCQKVLRMEQARKPHRCWQHKVLCPDAKLLAPHEKISNPKREASTAPALTVCELLF